MGKIFIFNFFDRKKIWSLPTGASLPPGAYNSYGTQTVRDMNKK